LEAMVVSGLPPPCTASVNLAMKSALGTFSLLTLMFGYLSAKVRVTLSSPDISLWLVKVCQYPSVPLRLVGAAVGWAACMGGPPPG